MQLRLMASFTTCSRVDLSRGHSEVLGPTPLQGLVDEINPRAAAWSLDPYLRRSEATVDDFVAAINSAAAESSWTQIV